MRPTYATLLLCFASLSIAASSSAVQIVIDYSRDTSALFDASTFNGQQARSAVEAAADQLSTLLVDSLSPIQVPDPFVTDRGVTFTWGWQLAYRDALSNEVVQISNATLAQDEYRIYVQGSSLGGTTLGIGSPGVAAPFGGPDSFGLAADDIAKAIAIEEAFFDSVNTRGKDSGYTGWGGAITLNTNRPWHRDHIAPVPGNRDDLYTTVLHEMIHTLGFGIVNEWHALRQDSTYVGEEAVAVHGGSIPLFARDNGHWAEGITSDVFRFEANQPQVSQSPVMAPFLNFGERKQITELDAAGLADLGWEIAAVAVPEPIMLTLLAMGASAFVCRRPSRQDA